MIFTCKQSRTQLVFAVKLVIGVFLFSTIDINTSTWYPFLSCIPFWYAGCVHGLYQVLPKQLSQLGILIIKTSLTISNNSSRTTH